MCADIFPGLASALFAGMPVTAGGASQTAEVLLWKDTHGAAE